MIYKYALTAVVAFGFGVALMDQLKEPKRTKSQPVAQQAILDKPIMKPDITVQHCTTVFKCGPERRYYIGMVRK